MPRKEKRKLAHGLIATTVLDPGLRSLIYAKSLCGSHISLTLFGRYPPTPPTRLFPKPNDLFFIVEAVDPSGR